MNHPRESFVSSLNRGWKIIETWKNAEAKKTMEKERQKLGKLSKDGDKENVTRVTHRSMKS